MLNLYMGCIQIHYFTPNIGGLNVCATVYFHDTVSAGLDLSLYSVKHLLRGFSAFLTSLLVM